MCRCTIHIARRWLIIESGSEKLPLISQALGAGKSDSIQFSRQAPKNTLQIVDDRLARRYDLAEGLYVIGTVRLLDLAKKRGLIQSAEETISDMASNGYRISIDLLQIIRKVENAFMNARSVRQRDHPGLL